MAQSIRRDFFQPPCDLLTAILTAGFNKGQDLIVAEAFTQVFGIARSEVILLQPADIARRRGMPSQNVTRGIRESIEAGVLERVSEHVYRFVLDWEQWKIGGDEATRQAWVAYVRNAPRMARDRLRSPHVAQPSDPPRNDPQRVFDFAVPDQSHQQKTPIESDWGAQSNSSETPIESDWGAQSNLIGVRVAAIEERARGIEDRERQTIPYKRGGGGNGVPGRRWTKADENAAYLDLLAQGFDTMFQSQEVPDGTG